MANYANLIQQINAAIRTNGANQITGQMLQTILDNMVASLGAKYQYAGVATPATNPGTPDQNVFYIAVQPGTYTNFGGLVVAEGEVAALKYNGAWAKDTTGAATADQVSQLGQKQIEVSNILDIVHNPDITIADFAMTDVYIDIPYVLNPGDELHFDITGMTNPTYGTLNIHSMASFSQSERAETIYAAKPGTSDIEFSHTCTAAAIGLRISYVYQTGNCKVTKTQEPESERLDNIESDVDLLNGLVVYTDVKRITQPVVTWAQGYVGNDGIPHTGGSFDDYDYCTFFPVKPGDVVMATFRAFCYKDANGMIVKASGSDFYTGTETTVPSGVAEMAVTVSNNHKRVLIEREESDVPIIPARRKEIYINITDTEEVIFQKMTLAVQQRDTDVYWEPGEYVFTDIFNIMATTYGLEQCELPVGGNCRYFFNGSTLKAIVNVQDFSNINLMGSMRLDSDYELHDGYLYAEGVRYVFHDETSGSPRQYRRLYKNMHFSRLWAAPSDQSILEKIIGGGMGQWGIVEFDGCTFKADSNAKQYITYHGSTVAPESKTLFQCIITNCLIEGHTAFYALANNQYGHIIFSNNKYKSFAVTSTTERFIVDSYCNEIITDS